MGKVTSLFQTSWTMGRWLAVPPKNSTLLRTFGPQAATLRALLTPPQLSPTCTYLPMQLFVSTVPARMSCHCHAICVPQLRLLTLKLTYGQTDGGRGTDLLEWSVEGRWRHLSAVSAAVESGRRCDKSRAPRRLCCQEERRRSSPYYNHHSSLSSSSPSSFYHLNINICSNSSNVTTVESIRIQNVV